MRVMCDVVREGEGEHDSEKREVVIRKITCCSLRIDATNESSDGRFRGCNHDNLSGLFISPFGSMRWYGNLVQLTTSEYRP